MANPNFSAPAISNKIASDIDSIRELAKLIARLRGDLADNAPDGTIIFNQTAMNFQMKNGTVWSALDNGTGKYAFNVDRLDGFHANAGIIANSIVVRDSKGVIPGNISGRAPNATQADELTTVNPIAKGGTGASTAAQARANLGTNDIGNLTAGVLPVARGGTGRTDGSAQDVQTPSEVVNANNSTAKGRGQIGGLAMGRGLGTDANLFTGNGRFWFNNRDALVNFPNNNIGGSLIVRAYATYSHQEYINYNNTGRFWRISQNTGSTWTPWYRVPEGLTDNYTTNSSVVAASAKALMNLKSYADTKLPLTGGTMTGRIGGLQGTYRTSWIERYHTSALEIRENDGVGNTQSDIGYAPTIGFHWANTNAGTLSLRKDGIFAFFKQDGSRATVDCDVPYASLSAVANHLNVSGQSAIWRWEGQSGQPTWVWGGGDGVNMAVWNPSNFSVNYANSTNYANSAGVSGNTYSIGGALGYGRGVYNYPDRPKFYAPQGGRWIVLYNNAMVVQHPNTGGVLASFVLSAGAVYSGGALISEGEYSPARGSTDISTGVFFKLDG
nr:MAG TPA: tail fiber protein [Caudoviricetes sp.]